MKRAIAIIVLATAAFSVADNPKTSERIHKARQQQATGNFPKAEKTLREAIQEDPNSAKAHMELGQLLAGTRRYAASAEEFERTLQIDNSVKSLSKDDRRIVLDGRGVGYALGGNLPKAKDVFEAAIKEDPEYALLYYNLACTYAEMGQLDAALTNLREAWTRRSNVLEGEQFPDPRKDKSFSRYLNNPQFQDAVRDMVF